MENVLILNGTKFMGSRVLFNEVTMREIKNVYLGLPFDFVEKVYWIDDEFRTNALSHEEGGFDIVVEYHTGEIFGYNRVKIPAKYVEAIFYAKFLKLKQLPTPAKHDFLKSKVSKIFARKHGDEKKYGVQRFKEVWNSGNPTQNITEALKN
ncbi:hypothetical protein [Segetibacter aerophilus]|uniref:Uncharacterized protein n=1 Tax=Segetibacter aerophilus TaxID=670293 RepID=A0A512B8N6_9BACT|nr:hypothetical protein [Segetibacter aerophilus]GEO08324.1 hypothetical protein SAE01_08200 [Segetibacter aerophilus]